MIRATCFEQQMALFAQGGLFVPGVIYLCRSNVGRGLAPGIPARSALLVFGFPWGKLSA